MGFPVSKRQMGGASPASVPVQSIYFTVPPGGATSNLYPTPHTVFSAHWSLFPQGHSPWGPL